MAAGQRREEGRDKSCGDWLGGPEIDGIDVRDGRAAKRGPGRGSAHKDRTKRRTNGKGRAQHCHRIFIIGTSDHSTPLFSLTRHLCRGLFDELAAEVQKPRHGNLGLLRHDVLHALIHWPGQPSATSDLRVMREGVSHHGGRESSEEDWYKEYNAVCIIEMALENISTLLLYYIL